MRYAITSLDVGGASYGAAMTFANAGTLGAVPGKRDELVAHLTRRSNALEGAGCLLYEVGVTAEDPDYATSTAPTLGTVRS